MLPPRHHNSDEYFFQLIKASDMVTLGNLVMHVSKTRYGTKKGKKNLFPSFVVINTHKTYITY